MGPEACSAWFAGSIRLVRILVFPFGTLDGSAGVRNSQTGAFYSVIFA